MMMQWCKTLMICSLVWLMLTACQATTLSGDWVKVLRVLSGQTIEVVSTTQPNALPERVRLIGIVSPHWQQQKDWNQLATAQLETWIGGGRTVLLESDVQPNYIAENGKKTRFAYVWRGQHLLNERLIEGGFVLAQARSPNLKYEERLSHAQEKARLTGVGIWNPQHPMRRSPNEFD